MDELTQLANALMALDDKLAACMKCGFCQAFCPMYMTTRIEGDLTRGKISSVMRTCSYRRGKRRPRIYASSVMKKKRWTC